MYIHESGYRVLVGVALLIGFSIGYRPAFADDEPPAVLPPISALPPLPFIDCKNLPDPGQDEKPIKGEKPVKGEHGDQKCLGLGAPIPGGGGGGSGNGGGGSPSIRNIPIRNTEIQADCSSDGEVRKAYAAAQVGPFQLSLRNGDRVKINYRNGQSERFIITNRTSSLPAEPVPGTCG